MHPKRRLRHVPGLGASPAAAAGLGLDVQPEQVSSDVNGSSCAGPCIRLVTRNARSISIAWRNPPDDPSLSETFNVRWTRPGLAGPQTETPLHSFRLDTNRTNTTYTFSVQGCKKGGFLSRSTCSPWSTLVVRPGD